jgi:2-polyprenyl-3-methyl-5-hydroxy-6-metoxy-1,4-benzoquinol methylase
MKPEPFRCIVCGSSVVRPFVTTRDYNWRFREGTFVYVRCSSCGLVCQYPPPSPESIAAYYPERYGGGSPSTTHREREQAIESRANRYRRVTINRVCTRAGRLLDVGCGSGTFMIHMQRRGWTVTGLETSAGNVERARSEYGLGGVVLGRWPDEVPSGPFRVITMFHLLEHLVDPLEGLRAARTHLEPGGYVVIETPNIKSLPVRLFRSHCTIMDAPRHLYLFDRRTLTAAIRKAGLHPALITTYSPTVMEYTESLRYLAEDLGVRSYTKNAHPVPADVIPAGDAAGAGPAQRLKSGIHGIERLVFRAVSAAVRPAGLGNALLAVARREGGRR